MVVDSPAALATTFLITHGHTANVAPIIVADENHHVVGHFQTCIVVVLHLFVERPHLGSLLSRFTRYILDNLTLIIDDALHQLRVRLVTHRLVAVATHTDGHNVLGTLHTFNALTEELVQLRLVRLIVPSAPLLAVTGILLVVAGHRLVVRGAHDNTHRVGQFTILRVVGIECPAPHGGPQEVTLQTQNQLEHFRIERASAIFSTKGILHPRRQTGCFVVQEDATKLDSGLSGSIRTAFYPRLRVLCHGGIGPPVPGRHAQLATQFIDTIDGTTLVAAGYDNCLSFWQSGNDEFLAFAFQIRQFQLVNGLVPAQRTDQDGGSICRFARSLAQHTFHVLAQVLDGHLHAFILLGAIAYRGISQRHAISLL